MYKWRVMVTSLLLVSLMAFAVSMAMVPAADAQEEWPCVYTGYAFGEGGVPVPDNTGIRVMDGLVVIGETTTGLWALADNQYYLDGIMAEAGTQVGFMMDVASWVPAIETATHVMYGYVEVDLHVGAPSMHVDARPFLFIYPWENCPLLPSSQALTNLLTDCTVNLVWGTEVHPTTPLPDGEESWLSYDPLTHAGWLGPFGLEQGKPYVITHETCVCTDWEMYIP